MDWSTFPSDLATHLQYQVVAVAYESSVSVASHSPCEAWDTFYATR
jgi:hypothetical protein